MSQKETTDLIGHLEAGESRKADLPKLAELARQAFEQKHKKDCLDLTRTILLIDPDNAAAQSMRSVIQSEMQRDLEDARALLRQAQSKENTDRQSWSVDERPPEQTAALEKAAGMALIPRRTSRAGLLARASIVLVLGLVVVAFPRFRTKSNPVEALPQVLSASVTPNPATLEPVGPVPIPVELIETEPTPSPAPPVAENVSTADRSPADVASVPQTVANSPAPRVIAPGTLAVSSPTSIDIYREDAYIGSAPVSLELPAGPNTLEYRHGNLRKSVTHVINSNETSRAMITFDVNVQINSKPWADVSLEGGEKKALGQTPLSGVRVPIGSVLIFENPRFQPKRYRVTGNETGIQIVFQ